MATQYLQQYPGGLQQAQMQRLKDLNWDNSCVPAPKDDGDDVKWLKKRVKDMLWKGDA